jgi:hypothetical protein
MNEESLLIKISELPNPVKIELMDYLEFLIFKHIPKEIKKHPKAGCMKGMFIMGDDFNDQLDCFKDYIFK